MRHAFSLLVLLSCAWSFPMEAFAENACTAADQAKHIYRENTDFTAAMSTCGRRAMGDARGTASCLVQRFPDLSRGCADCFGQAVSCTVANCLMVCSSRAERDDRCVACYKANCEPSLVTRSGVAAENLPRR